MVQMCMTDGSLAHVTGFCVPTAELLGRVTGFCVPIAELLKGVTGFCVPIAELWAMQMRKSVPCPWPMCMATTGAAPQRPLSAMGKGWQHLTVGV